MRVNSRGMVRGKYENGICLVKRPLCHKQEQNSWDQIWDLGSNTRSFGYTEVAGC